MAAALAPGVSRKLKKVLYETRTDSPDLLASLQALSSFYGSDNTPHSRRNLKSSIDQRALHINSLFLQASLPAQLSLDQVQLHVDSLSNCCLLIEKALSDCSSSTGDIITTTERLQQELDIVIQRQEIVSCFLHDYQLSGEEIRALREEDLSENFFKALAHVQEIHANCKTLLRTHHQRAGLELMDLMSVHQEGAYERLCRWVQAECRKLGDSDNPEVNDLLRKAVCSLKERPVLFKYCAEEVANMRHHALFRRFISALTRGGPGGLPRPIEVHAHDPLRYVNDMLGWLHQALASERELIVMLLDPDVLTDGRPTVLSDSRATEGDSLKTEPDATSVLDRIFEGACRPFKVRVEQVLQSQPSLIVSYKLSNTLEFYCYTISDLLGRETALSNTIWLLKDAAQQTFFNILKSRGEKILRYPPLVAADLSPPPAVREGTSLLLELIETYNSMMVSSSGRKPDFDPVISALLDPIIQMCEQAAEAQRSKGTTLSRRRSGLDSGLGGSRDTISVDAILVKSASTAMQSVETSSKIYLINCLSAIQEPLLGQETASNYVDHLRSMIEEHMNVLVEKEAENLLKRCGLFNKMPLIHGLHSNAAAADSEGHWRPLADLPETSPHIISECLMSFFGLITESEGSLPEFEQLQVPKLRSDARTGVARALSSAYELVYDAVMDPKNQYLEPGSFVKHSPDQIRTILQI